LPRSRCLPSPGCCLPRIRGHSGSPLLFFLLSARFATSLTFVFRSFPQLSHEARVLRPRQFLSMDFNASPAARPAPRSRREHGARAEDPSPSTGDSGSSSQASAPSPTRTSSKLERIAFSDGRHGTNRLLLHGDVPSAGGVSKCAAARPRLRQHHSPDLEERWSSRA